MKFKFSTCTVTLTLLASLAIQVPAQELAQVQYSQTGIPFEV